MKGTFYLVGVGPGDPELMTLKAARILTESPVWLVPAANKETGSTAYAIAQGLLEGKEKEIITHRFPMKKVHIGQPTDPEVEQAWKEAAQIVANHLTAGHDVAFPTLGDPAIYSTGFYLLDTLTEFIPDITAQIIPGVSAIGATSASAAVPLCLGDERLVVVPATFENDSLREILLTFDCVVLMKVHRVMDRLIPLLEELDLLDQSVLVERTSQQDQVIHHDLKAAAAEPLHYFSTMIVRRA